MAVKGFVPYSGIIRAVAKGFVPYSSIIRAVAFDMDGPLEEYTAGIHNSSWEAMFYALEKMYPGTLQEYGELLKRYEHRPGKDKSWFAGLLSILKGKSSTFVRSELLPPPYLDKVRETCDELKKRGIKRGIVSLGVSIVGDYIKEDLGLDFCLINRLYEEGGVFTGKGKMEVSFWDKGKSLVKLRKKLGYEPEEMAVVVDHITDMSMIEKAGLAFACNSHDPKIRKAADYIIDPPKSNLTKILKVLWKRQRDLASL